MTLQVLDCFSDESLIQTGFSIWLEGIVFNAPLGKSNFFTASKEGTKCWLRSTTWQSGDDDLVGVFSQKKGLGSRL